MKIKNISFVLIFILIFTVSPITITTARSGFTNITYFPSEAYIINLGSNDTGESEEYDESEEFEEYEEPEETVESNEFVEHDVLEEPVANLETPKNVTIEIRKREDGKPYFEIKWTNPQAILDLVKYWDNHGEAPLSYEIDMKQGSGKWIYEQGEYGLYGNSLHAGYDETGIYAVNNAPFDPINDGILDNVDIKANIYFFRVRYAYYNNGGYIYSSFSDSASIGMESFYKEASKWATAELNKAAEYKLIPDILIGDDMTKPITREEFCELVVLLCEEVTGKVAEPVSPNPFTDTVNPQILKANKLRITTGTSATKFSPMELINREQCATMLFRAIKHIDPNGVYRIDSVKDFPDQKYISNWAVEATKYMFKIGIILGDAKGNFMPKATTIEQEASGYGMATKEQAIALAVRTYEKYSSDKEDTGNNEKSN